MTDRQMRRGERRLKNSASIRVVAHHPWRQWLVMTVVVLLSAAGALGGYWLGRATSGLDSTYLASIERLNDTNRMTIERLEATLIEADLSRVVDQEAGRSLTDDFRQLKDELAALTEEVTFYKSLMAPSSLAKGLQIADFELNAMEDQGRYTFHLLLTQVENRRDWVQGEASLTVEGRMTGDQTAGSDSAIAITERVLSLTEIGEDDSYPLKFRFRYFQDLTGVISLPAGFEPERIVVRAGKRGASTEALTRTFDWTVAS